MANCFKNKNSNWLSWSKVSQMKSFKELIFLWDITWKLTRKFSRVVELIGMCFCAIFLVFFVLFIKVHPSLFPPNTRFSKSFPPTDRDEKPPEWVFFVQIAKWFKMKAQFFYRAHFFITKHQSAGSGGKPYVCELFFQPRHLCFSPYIFRRWIEALKSGVAVHQD